MLTGDRVKQHYGREGLEDAILAMFDANGHGRPTTDQLVLVDEFHSRARQATSELAKLAGLQPGMRVLDVGSGLGGPARHLAAEYGVHVTGIELTADYVRVARVLTERAGLADRVRFRRGNAVSAPFEMGVFDCAWLQHMLMNVADKGRLLSELRRVVKPGGRLALHEVVAFDAHNLHFPLPWGRTPVTSFVARPERLRTAVESASFELREWKDTSSLAIQWCRDVVEASGNDERLRALHALLGPDAVAMIDNFGKNLAAGRLGVVMAVFDRAS